MIFVRFWHKASIDGSRKYESAIVILDTIIILS
ncbi:hypothetical protein PAP10c_p3129 (plasmid) [Pantoea agglomerans]|nr:hypothetical protein PAP10c_p3129 [Pantoea agglomerans]